VRGQHPTDASWRADAYARSRHSDLRDEISPPAQDHDAERSAALCAEVCRNALGSLAAGLPLLPPPTRRRAQAAAACAVALFDFARQGGLEGEKLTQINRWEFELEGALAGAPTGQPVFVQISRLHRDQRWPTDLFDGLVAAARRRVARARPRDERQRSAECSELGRLALLAVGEEEPTPEALALAALLVRARRLLALGEDLRRDRAGLPMTQLPSTGRQGGRPEAILRDVVGEEQTELERRLRDARRDLACLPPGLRPAALFALAALRRLVVRLDPDRLTPAPELGLGERLWLLLVSRFRRS
jgi:hypothetical protein